MGHENNRIRQVAQVKRVTAGKMPQHPFTDVLNVLDPAFDIGIGNFIKQGLGFFYRLLQGPFRIDLFLLNNADGFVIQQLILQDEQMRVQDIGMFLKSSDMEFLIVVISWRVC